MAMRLFPMLIVVISVATKTRFLPLITASRQPVPLSHLFRPSEPFLP